MSEFQELSQAIGVAVHKATKENYRPNRITKIFVRDVLEDESVQDKVSDLVVHTINNTIKNK